MKVDHGITIPLFKLTGALTRYNVLPVFINCAADPRPSFKRVRNLRHGDRRIPRRQEPAHHLYRLGRPVARSADAAAGDEPAGCGQTADPARHADAEEYDARENRVIRAARDLVVGKGPCLPPDEQWDHNFLKSFVRARLEDFDTMTDKEIDRVAGFGAHEVRTWVAAAAAAKAMGKLENELKYYHLVPEWITGMGIVVGQA